MCGIFGFSGIVDKQAISPILIDLLHRGYHSVGFVYVYEGAKGPIFDDKINVGLKGETELFIHDILNHMHGRKTTFIFNNRYSTSGDWKDVNNAQPIQVDNAAIVMNGVISMGTKDEFEKEFGIQCQTGNDTELLLRMLLKNGSNPKDLHPNLREASFACAILQDGKITAFRNNKRPLYHYDNNGVQFVCSSLESIKKSKFYDWGTVEILPPLEKIEF